MRLHGWSNSMPWHGPTHYPIFSTSVAFPIKDSPYRRLFSCIMFPKPIRFSCLEEADWSCYLVSKPSPGISNNKFDKWCLKLTLNLERFTCPCLCPHTPVLALKLHATISSHKRCFQRQTSVFAYILQSYLF